MEMTDELPVDLMMQIRFVTIHSVFDGTLCILMVLCAGHSWKMQSSRG